MRLRHLLIPLVIVVAAGVQWFRPLPPLKLVGAQTIGNDVIGHAAGINWPTDGETALAVDGIGEIGHVGGDTPMPIASVTKVMTVYLVLKHHPLQPGQGGPMFTISKADEQLYQSDKAQGESVLPVTTGEHIDERQLLEGVLLPSGNNAATMLGEWTDGSLSAFVNEMNATAKSFGMTHTHYVDASGFDPLSQSTADDQLKIFEAAMHNPTFRQIVSEAQATVPFAGTIINVDYRLGHGGIIGGKTGSTSQAGGCFVFASKAQVAGKDVLIMGAVLGQQGSQPIITALNEGVTLSENVASILQPLHVLQSGTALATLQAPWLAQPVAVTAGQNVSFIGWPGMSVSKQLVPATSLPDALQAGQRVGTLNVTVGNQHVSLPLTTPTAVSGPSAKWRLTRFP